MSLRQDIRQTLRRLYLKPGVPLLIVILLGIGIGANTAIFSAVYGVLLRPLPYEDPDRLAVLWATIPKKDIRTDWTSWPTLQDWRNSSHSFVDVAGILRLDSATLTGRDEPMKVNAGRVSANLFSLLGASPLVGRTYTAEEERLREPPFWATSCGGASSTRPVARLASGWKLTTRSQPLSASCRRLSRSRILILSFGCR